MKCYYTCVCSHVKKNIVNDLGTQHSVYLMASFPGQPDYQYKHNCVLSNAGLSNAPTKTGICTSLKSDFYFRFHSIEYKVGIAEFYLYMRFGADQFTNVVTRA